ncbi:tape measure protein [Gilliamella sp. Nev3-1]|uniref:tape measure protein n=1 Tax=Gilliamella sp. Nev3-1 TaxID=3120250 RepID=UPI00080EC515|nr:tape measure protein [Gilliamella apicola]OCG59787.1 hypothetical protein A9G40_06120 [Gilliamella apicola]
MSFEAGSIYYTIDAKTGALLTADKQVSSFNKRAQERFNETDRSVNSLNGSMGKLTQVAKGVVAALVTNQVFAYANAWQDLEDRLKNTGLAGMALKDVQEQLMTTSNRNGRTIEESTELYVRLSNSMSELGYSTQGTLSYIDTLSNLFTINKTNAISAESAINALTKAQMKGKLAGIDAMSVFAAMPSVLKTLGKRLKKTEAEVRQMASDGKLSMSDFTDAMIAAQDETAALADNMRNNLGDASNHFTNRLKEVLGSLDNTTGATQHLVSGIKMLAENMNVLIGCAGFLSAILAGRYLTSLTAATRAKIASAIASRNETKEEVELARAELKRIDIERQSLSISLQFAEANYRAAKSVEDRIIQANRMSAIQAKMIALDKAETVTKNALSAATARANTAVNLLKGGLSLLGGPAGIAIMAAGALMTWASKANEAKQKALDFASAIDDVNDSLKDLSANQLANQIDQINDDLSLVEKQTKKAQSELKKLESYKKDRNEAIVKGYVGEKGLDRLEKEIRKLKSDIDTFSQSTQKLTGKLQSYKNALGALTGPTQQATQKTDKFIDSLDKTTKTKIDEKIKSLSTELEISEMKLSGAKKAAYIYENALSELGDESDKYKVALLGLINGTAEWADMSDEVRKTLEPLLNALGKMFDANEKLNSSKKSGRGTTRTYAEEIKNLKNQLEVAKLEAKGMTVEAKALAISQQIGTKATKAQADELKRLIQEQENLQNSQAGEDFAKQEIYNKKSPLEQIDIDEQEKLDKLSKWRETGLANEQTYQDALTAITQDAVDKRKKLEDEAAEAKLQSTRAILKSSSDLFGGMADMLGAFAGESSSAYKALFAISKGFAIADAMLNLNSAIMKAMNDQTATTTAAKMANMAAVASAGGQVLSTLKGITYGGGRLRGGGVDVGKAYRVNESGEPELFVAHGKQYMIPNKNGEVIPSNKLSRGSAGKTIINNITQNISFGDGQDNKEAANETARMLKQALRSVIQEEQRPGGLLNHR